jgi:hypothetical protein
LGLLICDTFFEDKVEEGTSRSADPLLAVKDQATDFVLLIVVE